MLGGALPVLVQQLVVLHLQIDVIAQDHQQFAVKFSKGVVELVNDDMPVVLLRADGHQKLIDLHLFMERYNGAVALFQPCCGVLRGWRRYSPR